MEKKKARDFIIPASHFKTAQQQQPKPATAQEPRNTPTPAAQQQDIPSQNNNTAT